MPDFSDLIADDTSRVVMSFSNAGDLSRCFCFLVCLILLGSLSWIFCLRWGIFHCLAVVLLVGLVVQAFFGRCFPSYDF